MILVFNLTTSIFLPTITTEVLVLYKFNTNMEKSGEKPFIKYVLIFL